MLLDGSHFFHLAIQSLGVQLLESPPNLPSCFQVADCSNTSLFLQKRVVMRISPLRLSLGPTYPANLIAHLLSSINGLIFVGIHGSLNDQS